MSRARAGVGSLLFVLGLWLGLQPTDAGAAPAPTPKPTVAVTTGSGTATSTFSWTPAATGTEGRASGGDPLRAGGGGGAPRPDPWAAYNDRLATCGEPIDSWCMMWALQVAPEFGPPVPGRPAPAVTRQDAEAVAREVVLTLKVAKPTPRVAPRTTASDGNMMVVGYPLWLWAEDGDTESVTETRYGITFTLNANRDRTVFDMGDGTTVTCVSTTPYDASLKAGTPSPTCGHAYQKASLPQGSYTVRATSHWTVQWSGMGFSGSLPLTSSDSAQVPVGELQAVVTR